MLELQVENMSCGHCVSSVTKAVLALDPQAKVTVDLAAKKVAVDSAAPVADIRSAIVEAGYPVN
ncbi:heavy-metal-associated domain-containing protein [Janthinobacterium agaricidamnosum]|uniref:Copper chaperone, heavy metal ion binding n=1 Tax=Janthinobacterium agaricidamnosum NBRC 102515 = DSM 9628 TaxID=1349767 RepID=W0VA94_9BURK|nr:cation transporter [Janthinobacterium agaricidamnosum]CDG84192.1 copper chaperone, heavy metal ion binding [Janthinobacterium agaricidamnosum NBRC 102515 = DSM 9628]